ncbi:MAG: hypothetical protein K2J85_03160 [Anaeroplasmataceae bacterium]|nr:hypothetical protein [Anaeroplasmataceae bacterium]
MDKKELLNKVKSIMKEEGYIVKNNKFMIEYPLCYVQVGLYFPRGIAELEYNISIKEIHGTLTKEEINDYTKWDFCVLPKLNYEHRLYSDCHFDLLSLGLDEVEIFVKKQLEEYIKPFENDLINYLKKGRLFKYVEEEHPHYEQFYMEKVLKEYLSKF